MTKQLQKTLIILLTCLFFSGSFSLLRASEKQLQQPLESFSENFDLLNTPELPANWWAHVEASSSFATIGSSSIGTAYSAPNHLRFANSTDPNPVMIAGTPLVTSFQNNWLTFTSYMTSALYEAELVVGYLTNPADISGFVAYDTLVVSGNTFKQFYVRFNDPQISGDYHIAFQYLPAATNNILYIDNVEWTTIPSGPIAEISPSTGDFGSTDLNAVSGKTFSIRNIGIQTLTINQSDITFTGTDATSFSLDQSTVFPIELQTNESYDLTINFNPQTSGNKIAQAEIASNSSGSPAIIPLTGTGLGTLSAFFEDFSDSQVPELPGGWSDFVQSTSGSVTTLTSFSPFSDPVHVKIMNGSDSEAVLFLIGPKVNGFDVNWLRFYAKNSSSIHSENLVVGYVNARDNVEDFVPVDTVLIEGNNYSQYNVMFDGMDSPAEKHLAFRFIPSSSYRVLYVDDILWEVAPTEPVVLITPDSLDFGLVGLNMTSEPLEFSLLNDGAIPVTVNPDDITISGTDATEFHVAFPDPIVINPTETATVPVFFTPSATGGKSAILSILGKEIFLSGLSEDPSITQFPYLENFDQAQTPNLPLGWRKMINHPSSSLATVEVSSSTPNSGPNSLRLYSNNDAAAIVMAITPHVDGLSTKRIRFQARVNLSSNIPSLKIGTMSDPTDFTTFNEIGLLEAGVDITENYQELTIALTQAPAGDNYLAFKQEPTPAFFRSIYIDDLVIEENPTDPVLVVQPDTLTFEEAQVGSVELIKQVTISNDGAGLLVIEPSDISISGTDAGRFSVGTIIENINLQQFETAIIDVTYSYSVPGNNQAVLNIAQEQVVLTGSTFDATITELPHFENFDNVATPSLPQGWSAIVDNSSLSSAIVETSTNLTPYSDPAHVKIHSNNNADAHVSLVSPPVVNLGSTRVSFYAKSNMSSSVPDLIIGSMSNPADASTFTALDTIFASQMTNSYGELFTVTFNTAPEGDSYFAFLHRGNATFARSILIDDILLEEIPDIPVLMVTPDIFDFQYKQIGEISDYQDFLITNNGGGTLVVNPSEIALSGTDASEFILNNLTEEANLLAGESIIISVAFAPSVVGIKQANLEVKNEVISLTGQGIDATISSFPWTESFTDVPNSELPLGWLSNRTNWGVNPSSSAGGSAPELRLHYSPVFDGIGYVKSPKINTTGYQSMMLTFRNYISNFSSPGPYTLKVSAIAGENEYLIKEWVDPVTIDADELTFILTAEEHGIGAEDFYLVWTLDGNSNGLNQWYIDDVTLSEAPELYTVTFNVTDQAGTPLTDAVITLGSNTNEAGDYVFNNVFEGTYSYLITADHFETVSAENILINSDTAINAEMTAINYTVTFTVNDTEGNTINDAIITFGDVTNTAGDYVFDNVQAGTYNYLVEAENMASVEVMDFEVIADTTIETTMSPVTYAVTFNVKDENGSDITDAIITLGEITNAAGDYNFVVTQGTYYYSVVADEYHTVTVTDLLVDSDMIIEVELTMVSYTVNFDVKNQQGDPITDATVTFNGQANAEGDYEFAGIGAGTYNYSVTADNYIPVEVEALEVNQDATIEVLMTLVTHNVTFIIEDQEGQAIDDAIVTLGDITNESGEYVFENILTGTYDYSVQADGYDAINVTGFQVSQDEVIEVVMTLTTHVVTFTVEDEEGVQIPEAVVTFGGITNDPGMYVYNDVLPGTYRYTVVADGFEPVVSGNIEVAEDMTICVVMIAVTPTYSLSFIIENQDGETINDAVVTLEGVSYEAGVYNFDELLAGTYSYTISKDGFIDVEEQVTIVDDNMEITVVMQPDNVGIAEEGDSIGFNLFPNPATAVLNISSAAEVKEIRIIDMTGKIVFTSAVNENNYQVNVSSFDNGIYFMQLITVEGVSTERFQVSK